MRYIIAQEMVPVTGLEPATFRFEGGCSDQLSYTGVFSGNQRLILAILDLGNQASCQSPKKFPVSSGCHR